MWITTTWWINAENIETSKVMNYMSGRRTVKQIVWEYFWLREEAIYDDNWENIIDFINEFKDLKKLEQKKVKYVPRLLELWVTEEAFNNLFLNWLPILENGKTNWWEQVNTWSASKTQKK